MPFPKSMYDEQGFKHIKDEHRTVVRLNAKAEFGLVFEKDVNGNWWLENNIREKTGEEVDGIVMVKGRQRIKIESDVLITWLNRHHPWDEQGVIQTESERFEQVTLEVFHRDLLIKAMQSLIT